MNLKTLEKRIQEIKSKDPDAIDKDVKIYLNSNQFGRSFGCDITSIMYVKGWIDTNILIYPTATLSMGNQNDMLKIMLRIQHIKLAITYICVGAILHKLFF